MQAPSPACSEKGTGPVILGVPSPFPNGRIEPVISLVFPTYNPGPRLDRTWHELSHFLQTAPGNWEVLFVCDGCTDGTPGRLAEWARSRPGRIRVLSHAPNRGKGYAVRRGLEAAQGEWRLFTDVDLAYSFEDVLRVANALRAGADVAIASRTHPDSRIVVPMALQGYAYRRHLQSQLLSMLVRRLLPVTQRDTQAGLKGMSARAARLVLPHLRCLGFGFDCELLTACARLGLAVEEVPVSVRYEDKASTTSPRQTLHMLRELWQIRRGWRLAPMMPMDSAPRRAA
jgi:dolichyl-phosphate beta-glucosyltransferase